MVVAIALACGSRDPGLDLDWLGAGFGRPRQVVLYPHHQDPLERHRILGLNDLPPMNE